MTDNEQSQLRFDISEKVMFHRDQPGIDTLLSLDLTPEVRIADFGDNVQIQGSIRLNGTYLGESTHEQSLAEVSEWDEQEAGEKIEYVIPVEITLPSERAGRLEDITAEIQSFDYDVLSPHELGIEAELVINGLTLGNSGNALHASFGGKKEEDKEETEQALVKGHDNGEEAFAAPFGFRPYPAIESSSAPPENEPQAQVDDEREGSASDDNLLERAEPQPPTDQGDEKKTSDGEDVPAPDQELIEPQEENEVLAQTEVDVEDVESETQPPLEEEKHETKIHFYKKEEKQSADTTTLDGLLNDPAIPNYQTDNAAEVGESSAASPGIDYESSAAAQEHGEDDNKQTPNTGKNVGIEWMKQKLGGGEDRFHQLKMVIVQKDDTLEGIADRYEMSSVELLQLNKLESGELEQGQIVYIPVRDS